MPRKNWTPVVTDFIRGTGSHDAVDAEVNTVWALEALLHSGDDDD